MNTEPYWNRLIGMLLNREERRTDIYKAYGKTEHTAPTRHAWVLSKAQETSFEKRDWVAKDLITGTSAEQGEGLYNFLADCKLSSRRHDSVDLIFAEMDRATGKIATPPYVYSGQRARELADSPPPDNVVAGLLHRGHVTVLSAPPYSGKSWFALNVASAIASVSTDKPTPWPGAVLDCPGTPVVYISPDFPASELARRLRKLDQQRKDLVLADSYWDNVHLVGDSPGISMPRDRYGLDSRGVENIITELVPNGASLVVIDTLSASLPHDVTENDNGGMARTMGYVQQIASERDVAVLLIHHTAKPTAGKGASEVWSSVRGASAISGSASSNCLIEQLPDDAHPNIRRLRTVSNVSSGLPTTHFEVRPSYLETDEILYFRPVPDPTKVEDE